jgi:diguanylate cyclase (GGDEF)-like protein
MQPASRAHPNNASRRNNGSGRNGASGSNGKFDRTPAAGALERLSGWQLDVLVRDFARFIDSEVATLCQLGVKGQSPVVISSWGLRTAREEILRPREGGFVGRASSLPRAAFVPIHPLLDSELAHARNPPLSHAVAAPVRLATKDLVGELLAGFATPPPDRGLALWAAEAYAALVALCVQDGGAPDGLFAAGRRDALTGCLSYEGTRYELECEINRSARRGLALSVCFIDLDNFKRINDAGGHLRGNEILAIVGGALRAGVRSCDTIGRYGGDEFVAILPETNQVEACQVAERLRSALAATLIPSVEGGLTASIGVAQWVAGTGSEVLLQAADRALLEAKSSRAGVVSATAAIAISA